MQTDSLAVPDSTTDSTPHLPQSQSLAAQLPIEILDTILQFLQFNYDVDASVEDVTTRNDSLGGYSRVAKGWLGPARALLFANVKLRNCDELLEAVQTRIVKRYRKFIKTLWIDMGHLRLFKQGREEVANAIFTLLSRSPNIVSLVLNNVQFDRFNERHSLELQNFDLLPSLRHLRLYSHVFHSDAILHDLLATSSHSISRFFYLTVAPLSAPHVRGRGPHDFGGKLRALLLDGPSVGRLLDSEVTDLESLAGLEELRLLDKGASGMAEGTDTMEEVFDVIRPTLKTLYLTHNLNAIAPFLPLFPSLVSLDLDCYEHITEILLNLPPSLRRLRLRNADDLHLAVDSWNQHPLLAPKLHELAIDTIHDFEILKRLPRVDTFATNFDEEIAWSIFERRIGDVFCFDSGSLSVRFRRKQCRFVPMLVNACREIGAKLMVVIAVKGDRSFDEYSTEDSGSESSSDAWSVASL